MKDNWCGKNLGEWKELDWFNWLGVAHIYNCIPVFQQFHQIELRVKNLKIQLKKENKCKKKKMKNEMLKWDRENRF